MHFGSIVRSKVNISTEHLKPGAKAITLLSDTEYYSIAVFLPGPVRVARFDNCRERP